MIYGLYWVYRVDESIHGGEIPVKGGARLSAMSSGKIRDIGHPNKKVGLHYIPNNDSEIRHVGKNKIN